MAGEVNRWNQKHIHKKFVEKGEELVASSYLNRYSTDKKPRQKYGGKKGPIFIQE